MCTPILPRFSRMVSIINSCVVFVVHCQGFFIFLTLYLCFPSDFTGNADMPFDFFLSRYFEAYVTETEAFCKSLVEDSAVPCTGIDGLIALVMSLAADKSAAEGRWVKFSEIIEQVYCSSPTECSLMKKDCFEAFESDEITL